jgi:hypothetical protein
MKHRAFGDSGEFREAPEEFVVVRKGENRFTINGKQSTFVCGDEEADSLCKEFNDRQKDLVVDWDHATLDKRAASSGDAPAAGWVKLLRDETGNVVAKVINWTQKAKDRFLAGEYRYISPVLAFDEGKPRAVQSIGITNHPAIHGSMPLVAASDAFEPDEQVDEVVESVYTNYKEMARSLKEGVSQGQELLRQCLASMHDLGDRNPGIKESVISFADGLFAEDLKAFQDISAPVVPTLADVQTRVQNDVLQNKTVDAVVTDATQTIGQRASILADMLSRVQALLNSYNAMVPQVPDEAKPTLEAITSYLSGIASEIQGALGRIDAVATQSVVAASDGDKVVAFADGDADAAAASILDYIRKVLKNVPMSEGEVVKKVIDELAATSKLPKTDDEDIVVTPPEPVVPEVVQKMHDLCLTKDCNDDELLLAMNDAVAAKKERDEFLAKLGCDSLGKAKERLLSLSDAVRTLEATIKVDSTIKSGKMTMAMRDWGIAYAKRDPKGFEDHVAKAPVMFSDVKLLGNDEKPRKKAYTPMQRKVAEQFGHTPEEVYEDK